MAKTSLNSVFQDLKKILSKYEKGLSITGDQKTSYNLYSAKEVFLAGKMRTDNFFAGIKIQGSFVGFYFMPIYTHPELTKIIPEELRKKLKGKSCFHIKTQDNETYRLIDELLKQGYDFYKKEKIM